MTIDPIDVLHAPLLPILRHILTTVKLPRAGMLLDVACGAGLKAALLAEACGPDVVLAGVDRDRAAISAGIHSGAIGYEHWLVGDALALPLQDGCCAAACCIAALGLFADRAAALREMARVVRPGGVVLVATSAHMWMQVMPWPAKIGAQLAEAYTQALAAGHPPVEAAPDLGGELAALLRGAGLPAPRIRAFLLDYQAPAVFAPDAALAPLDAELPLLPWPALRSVAAEWLTAAELAYCDQAVADVELRPVALAGWANVAY